MKCMLSALILFGVTALANGEGVVFSLRITEFALGRPFYVFDIASTETSNGIRKMRPGITDEWTVAFEGNTTPELIDRLYRHINRVDVFALADLYEASVFDGEEAVFEFTLEGKTKRIFVSNCYHDYFSEICDLVNQMFPDRERLTFAPSRDGKQILGLEMRAAEPARPDNAG